VKANGLADLSHRWRVTVPAEIAADEVEDLALALRQVLDQVHQSSSVSRQSPM
jgi:HAMP domain-containing protein